MKIAILSDIHGNMPALQVVTEHVEKWGPDQVVVNGDIVNRGPLSDQAWAWVAEKKASAGWLITNGNHEDYVLYHTQADAVRSGLKFELHYSSYWVYKQVKPYLEAMAQLPEGLSLKAGDGRELRLRHASMISNRHGIWPHMSPEELAARIDPPPAVFATAHVHIPYIFEHEECLIVNSGSVGTPRDGDLRASYAQVTWHKGDWQAEIIRLPYDRAQADKHFFDSGFLPQAGWAAYLIYHEWRTGETLVPNWFKQYETAVLAGEISAETAVRVYLEAKGVEPGW